MDHTNRPAVFSAGRVLHELKHYLPSQTPLKDFIHHNSLHAFQELPFYEAIFQASAIFGFQVTLQLNEYRKLYATGRIRPEILDRVIDERKGAVHRAAWRFRALEQSYHAERHPRIGRLRANWKTHYQLDLDNLVQPLLFRILCSYLDQGVALWHFPNVELGLLDAVRALEEQSFSSFFQTKSARALLFDPACTLETLLGRVVGDAAFYEEYLFDQQFSHRGWSGLVSAIEDQPDTLLYRKHITLHELIVLELLLEIDALNAELGDDWPALAHRAPLTHTELFAPAPPTELQEVLTIWQDAFEWSYYDEVLAAVRQARLPHGAAAESDTPRTFQAIFCIDERECSLRRHLEEMDPDCETLSCPGFFGVEFYFHPTGGKFYEKLCPAPVTPKYLVKEVEAPGRKHHEVLYAKQSHGFLRGFLFTLSLGVWAAVKLVLAIFRPKMSPAISNAFAHMHLDAELVIENRHPDDRENGLQVGFTVPEMADRVEALLRGIGLVDNFASLVYVVAHGSSSANNPHHGAYDCGACAGRPGATNARVFAFMANHAAVRTLLDTRGLHIPPGTRFVGAMHNTASDEIGFYDDRDFTGALAAAHERYKQRFEDALDLNAKERSRRFASIDTRQDLRKVRAAIRRRSVSFFEPRPELGHSTNALCFVGHRAMTRGLFLDRRAFMNSYDFRHDPDGKLLLGVLRPLPPVCGGINLEYYFSRVDNHKLGAGTKLSHNVMGLIGVANSSDGDLRPGLPLQMIEVHDPIRLLILVEHYPDVVLRTVQTEPALYAWFEQEWVHLVAIHPDSNVFYRFRNGAFEPYLPLKNTVPVIDDVRALIESAREMKTNYIVDATQENLPVHVLKNK